MANNHMGDVAHGKLIIDQFADICTEHDINAAIKFQFRQLDTFIHRDFIGSDLKYVKRFKETRLSKAQFGELIQHTLSKGLKTCCTAFDNESVVWLKELDISVIKVASCSIDDWPLLEQISNINKRTIISTAGADMSVLHRVYDLFKSKDRDFAFMHCVADYPTSHDRSNLERIKILQQAFLDIEIGYSTHESPDSKTTSIYAIAMGCTVLEKHVGVSTEAISLNAYSLSPRHFKVFLDEVEYFQKSYFGQSETQKVALRSLKRGVYFSKDLPKGAKILKEDIYFCMPVQQLENDCHLDASHFYEILGKVVETDIIKDSPVKLSNVETEEELLASIRAKVSKILEQANIPYKNEELEISCHFGLEHFNRVGCGIINKINREYCKKLIIVLPNQSHPTHKHIQKEECFELIHGDCTVTLEDQQIQLQKGKPLLVPRESNHSFKSENGCIVEEISTTHIRGDSIYSDPNINKLPLSKRKIFTVLEKDIK